MKKFQVIFLDYEDDEFPYTLDYFDSKQQAEEWANEREFDYWDDAWSSARQDYVYQQFFRYHNPEDSQVYHGYEVREVQIQEPKITENKSKIASLKKLIREEIKKVLQETTIQKGDFLYLSDYNEFLAKLEELWGKKKSEWAVMKDRKEVSPSTKFTEKDAVSYSIDNLSIGEWSPTRPQTPSKLPPGAVNIKTNMSYSDLVYPEDSWRD